MSSIHEIINSELNTYERIIKKWDEFCSECKHAYKRKNDDDYLYCRLRKKKCPHLRELSEMAERKEE